MLDVNRDGIADIAVGAFGAHRYTGVVAIHLGSASGPSTTASIVLSGMHGDNGMFGINVASAGDVNGDGYGDLIVGESAQRDPARPPGAAYVFLGRSDGMLGSPFVLRGLAMGDRFGHSVAAIGDQNADGYGDCAVGAPYGSGGYGTITVYGGAPVGPPYVLMNIGGTSAGLHAGVTVRSAGDVDGDGIEEVAVATDANDLWIYTRGGIARADAPTVLAPTPYGQFGFSLGGPGDLNGDGFSDVLGGAPERTSGTHTGGFYVYNGAATGLNLVPATVSSGSAAGSYTGWAVAMVGDIDRDGYDEAMIGSPGEGTGGTGVARLYFGSPGGISGTAADATLSGLASWELGRAVSGGSDANGDGFPDVILGAPGANSYSGLVLLQSTNSTGFPSARGTQILAPACCSGGGFGWAASL